VKFVGTKKEQELVESRVKQKKFVTINIKSGILEYYSFSLS
jgi:hypothetical protein